MSLTTLSPLSLFTLCAVLSLGCMHDPAELEDDAASSSGALDGDDTDAEPRAAPSCVDGEQLKIVDCSYRVTGSAMTSACTPLSASVLPDGKISVTAEGRGKDCACEWNSPGNTGTGAGTCTDLGQGYHDPLTGAEDCPPQQTTASDGWRTAQGVGVGDDYAQAELAALAACAANGATQCTRFCANWPRTGWDMPKREIACCVPNTDVCGDEPCDVELDDAQPMPAPDAPPP